MATRKTAQAQGQGTVTADEIARKIALASAPAWRPNPGDTLLNPTVVGVRKGGVGGEYGTYPILVVESTDGDILAIHAFHTLLRDRLAEIKPTPGTVIESITYLGEKITNASAGKDEKDQTSYHHYVVTMAGDETAEEYDWS